MITFVTLSRFYVNGRIKWFTLMRKQKGQNQSAFSISQLKPLLAVHLIPINRLVLPWPQRALILRLVSHLDAFSGYLSVHSYPAFPIGIRTGTPLARPPRSSRTMGGFSQCSNAYTGYGPNCLTTF